MDTAELLACKPEVWLPLDEAALAELRRTPRLVLAEIAGRDSLAALLQYLAEEPAGAVLPTLVYTGTEYGDRRVLKENIAFLQREVPRRYGAVILDSVWLGSPRLWWALNGRFLGEIERCFGRYSPCLACHMYLHAMRIPLALRLGGRPVVGGDRERHDHQAKINQIAPALEAYRRLYRDFDLELHLPLRHVTTTDEVQAILGPDWPGTSPQLRCVLGGNYRRPDGSSDWDEEQVRHFMDGLAHPVLHEIVGAVVQGRPVDYETVVKENLSRCKSS